MAGPELLSRNAAAQILGTSRASIIRLEQSGKLRVHVRKSQPGNPVFFRADDVDRLRREREAPRAREAGQNYVDRNAIMLLEPALLELGSMGFGDEHGIVTSASIIAAAKTLRQRLREARLAGGATTEQPAADGGPAASAGAQVAASVLPSETST